jgi:hypothetical protein
MDASWTIPKRPTPASRPAGAARHGDIAAGDGLTCDYRQFYAGFELDACTPA